MPSSYLVYHRKAGGMGHLGYHRAIRSTLIDSCQDVPEYHCNFWGINTVPAKLYSNHSSYYSCFHPALPKELPSRLG
jgi:hypothetical protein